MKVGAEESTYLHSFGRPLSHNLTDLECFFERRRLIPARGLVEQFLLRVAPRLTRSAAL